MVGDVLSNVSSHSFIVRILKTMGIDLGTVLRSPAILYGLYFLVMLFATHALFRSILRKVLGGKIKGNFDSSQVNVISFAISFIGTSGIFFIYRANPQDVVLLFGGSFGFLIVLTFMIGCMMFFKNWANKYKTDEGKKGKGFYLVMSLGGFLVSNFLLYYMTTWLKQMSQIPELYKTIYQGVASAVDISTLLVIGFLISLFIAKKKRGDYNELLEKSPELRKLKSALEEIKKRVQKINKTIKVLKKTFSNN